MYFFAQRLIIVMIEVQKNFLEVQYTREEILHKQTLLNKAREQLKKEFVGIDKVIDEIVSAISGWFCFPSMQKRPVVANLWGLTGVGKSSLIQRLAQCINFEKGYYHFELGKRDVAQRGRASSIQEIMENIYGSTNGLPVLIVLDEFQHVRTIKRREEVERSKISLIWQLLDSGMFQTYSQHTVSKIYGIKHLASTLKELLREGVQVANGKIVKMRRYFNKKIDSRVYLGQGTFGVGKETFDIDKNELFVPYGFHEDIYELNTESFGSPLEVADRLRKMSGLETVKWLEEMTVYGFRPSMVDCSKAFIFVIGNLDEAYTMNRHFNPDISADEFHEISLKITVPTIKEALKERFRSEEIARLGNTHIIYPAFNRESFRKIIQLELRKLSDKMYDSQGIKLHFDTSIETLIYKEGVYPTQGTRPIFSTVQQIICAKFGQIITEAIVKKLSSTEVQLKAKDSTLIVEYLQEKKVLHTFSIELVLNLEKERKSKRDDVQAIVAVHEAGHAVLSSVLLGTVPEIVLSSTAAVDANGSSHIRYKWSYVARKEIKKRLAVDLGGYVAEELVFGRENITTGAEEDIKRATHFITKLLKECGMGKGLPATYHHAKILETNLHLLDKGQLTTEAEAWLAAALELAEKTLQKQEKLLLKIADYLSDNHSIDKEQIKKMLSKYASNFDMDSIIENGDHLFYRRYLKEKVATIQVEKKARTAVDPYVLSLSKNGKSRP